jgi:uncharacterized phage-like protein YoqJ
MKSNLYTACFTGHRKLNGQYEGGIWQKLSGHMAEVVIPKLTKEYGVGKYISGMALGVDMLAAESVLYNKHRLHTTLELHAAVPYRDQYKIWSMRQQKRYHRILERCDVVHNLYGLHHKINKLHRRNTWMINESNYVVAFWDGTESGGTFNCYSHAKKKNKSIIVINPYTLEWDLENCTIQI